MLKVVDLIGLFNVEWHSQNEFGNIGILLLLRDRKKLYWLFPISKNFCISTNLQCKNHWQEYYTSSHFLAWITLCWKISHPFHCINTSVSENNCITNNGRLVSCAIICMETIYNAILLTDLSKIFNTTTIIFYLGNEIWR